MRGKRPAGPPAAAYEPARVQNSSPAQPNSPLRARAMTIARVSVHSKSSGRSACGSQAPRWKTRKSFELSGVVAEENLPAGGVHDRLSADLTAPPGVERGCRRRT